MWHYFPSPPLPTEFPGYAPANLNLFYKNLYALTKTRNDQERSSLKPPETIQERSSLKPPETIQKLSETNQKTTDITWNQSGNNRYPMQPAISHKSSSGIWNTSDWIYFTEQSDSAARIYLFKVLRRQATDIINIINVPVSLLLTFNSYQNLL